MMPGLTPRKNGVDIRSTLRSEDLGPPEVSAQDHPSSAETDSHDGIDNAFRARR